MSRPRHVILLLLLLWLGAACGGRTSTDGHSAVNPDAGPPDAPVEASPPPEAAPEQFCEGSSKAELAGVLVAPAAVTSELVIMNCCDGFTLRFHTETQLGSDVSIMVRYFGSLFEGGSFELPMDGGPLEVSAHDDAGPPGEDASVSGTLGITVPASPDELSFASGCLTVSAPGQSFDGVRLHAANVPVAPYAWADRFEVHLLQDPTITAEQAAKQPLGSLTLKDVGPLLDLLAVQSYDATSHTLSWGSWYTSPNVIDQLPPVGTQGLPFVVVANGTRAYLGAFVSSLSSFALELPVVVIEDMKEKSFRIEPGYPIGAPPPAADPRNHPEVLGVLEAAGKLVK